MLPTKKALAVGSRGRDCCSRFPALKGTSLPWQDPFNTWPGHFNHIQIPTRAFYIPVEDDLIFVLEVFAFVRGLIPAMSRQLPRIWGRFGRSEDPSGGIE